MIGQSIVVSRVAYAGAHASEVMDTVVGLEAEGFGSLQLHLSPQGVKELVDALLKLEKLRATGFYDDDSNPTSEAEH